MNNDDECEEPKSFADEVGEKAIEVNDNPSAITRSVHISTRYGEVTVTTQAVGDDMNMIRDIAEKLVDKYLMTEERSPYTQ